jgi:hypothetical protein
MIFLSVQGVVSLRHDQMSISVGSPYKGKQCRDVARQRDMFGDADPAK